MKFTHRKETQPSVETTTAVGSTSSFRFSKGKPSTADGGKLEKKVGETEKKENTGVKPVEKKEKPTPAPKPQSFGVPSKILPKFINKSPKAPVGTGLEFSNSAFNLTKIDKNGYRDSFEGKMLLNFWTFDKVSNAQLDFIPAYIDLSEWLNICHMITSGRLYEMTEEAKAKQQAGGYKYTGYIYQSNGGSYSDIFKLKGKKYGGHKDPTATVFKITPAMKENQWIFSAEIFEGQTSDTGLISPKPGKQALAKINVLLSFDDLVRVARMSEMVIQAHFTNIYLG